MMTYWTITTYQLRLTNTHFSYDIHWFFTWATILTHSLISIPFESIKIWTLSSSRAIFAKLSHNRLDTNQFTQELEPKKIKFNTNPCNVPIKTAIKLLHLNVRLQLKHIWRKRHTWLILPKSIDYNGDSWLRIYVKGHPICWLLG